MISLDAVSKSFDDGRTLAVREVSLSVERGERLVLLGESGCGKTTTLKMINRLVEPTTGRICIDGEDHRTVDAVALRRRIGYVFQGIGLFPHFNVAENVATVPRLLGWDRVKIDARVDELLDLVGLPASDYATRRPHELSGGQRQRVGVARALAARPELLLMDEPFGALDPITRVELQDQFAAIQRDLGVTVILVTHDLVEALLLADRIAVMNAGRIVALDTPAVLMADHPDEYVRALMATPKRQADRVEALARGQSGDGVMS